jgi:hypothetical protein
MWLTPALAAVAAVLPVASASRLTPNALPLAVRNPYLSTWLQNAREDPWEHWPRFWTGRSIGFSVMASLPDERTTYPLLGRAQDSLHNDDDEYVVPLSIRPVLTHKATASRIQTTTAYSTMPRPRTSPTPSHPPTRTKAPRSLSLFSLPSRLTRLYVNPYLPPTSPSPSLDQSMSISTPI